MQESLSVEQGTFFNPHTNNTNTNNTNIHTNNGTLINNIAK